jgi:DNA repair protein RecO
VRRAKSHVAGKMEFMTEATLTLHRGRNLDLISSASIVKSHWNALVEPGAFATANLLAELVDTCCELDYPMPEIYELLVGAAAAIAVSDAPTTLVPRFELRLMHALGVAPPADRCVRCEGTLDEGSAWVDTHAGGLACVRCAGGRGGAVLDEADVANFRGLGAARGGNVRPVLAATPRVAHAVDALLTYHLGRRPRSRASLDELPA